MRRSALVLFLLAPVAGILSGQRCLGSNPYGTSHFRVGAGIDLDRHAETYGVDFRYSSAGVFGIVDAAQKTWVETFTGDSRLLGLTVGVAFPRDGWAKWSVCPMLAFNSTSGPKGAWGAWYYSEEAFSGAVSLGYLLSRSSWWDIVPTTMLTVGTTNPTMTGPYGMSLGRFSTFCCGPRGFGNLSFGLGIVLSGNVTILPSISLPLDATGETLYSVHFVIGGGT